MRAVNQCENLELYPSNEWYSMKMVKHEGRDVEQNRVHFIPRVHCSAIVCSAQ